MEHHLGPQTSCRFETLPVVRPIQDRIRLERWRCSACSQRPLVGSQGDHQADHSTATGSRHPGPSQQPQRRRRRCRGRVVGIAGHSGQLRAHRLAVGGHRAADLCAAGAAGCGCRPRALALCTPRDVVARDAGLSIANSRLSPATEDAIAAADGAREAGQFSKADPAAAHDALSGETLPVRIGYQGPNARLAATVGTIAKACAVAGISVSSVTLDSSTDPSGPQALRDGKIDVLLASTGGATGSGSSGSSSMDAYDLHTGNGNNLSGYANAQVDNNIGALAVSADPAERVRLLADSAPVLWADMPTLPLYRQQRMLLMSKTMYAVTRNPTRWGAGWNMDRWALVR
uniref:DciAE n=1 Tax=Mycobacterium leprae TaxID=1769 RepID=Q49638_MYCLR|nr:dciAE [Mycobacterium leprae]